MNVRDCESFDGVTRAELDEIALRRQVVQSSDSAQTVIQNETKNSRQMPTDLVGVSLSGGGLRSASISLGFIQSLYDRGVLKSVDYLSTVSGGGYAGALLSSSLQSAPDVDWTPSETKVESSARILPFSKLSMRHTNVTANAPDGLPQPPLVRRIANQAGGVFGVLGFASRQIYGLLTTNLFALASIMLIVTLLSWVFRWVDTESVSVTLSVWGFNSDIKRAFVPTIFVGSLWLLAMAASSLWRKAGRRFPPISTWLCAATVASAIMSVLMLVANGNNDFGSSRLVNELQDSAFDTQRELIRWIGYLILAAISIAMSPILAFNQLIRSGVAPKSHLQTKFFNIVSWAILLGAPCICFYYFSRENLSNHNSLRSFPFSISRLHIRDWNRFASIMSSSVTPEPSESVEETDKQPLTETDKVPYDTVVRSSYFSSADVAKTAKSLIANSLGRISESGKESAASKTWSELQHYEWAVRHDAQSYGTLKRFAMGLESHIVNVEEPASIRNNIEKYLKDRDNATDNINRRFLCSPMFLSEVNKGLAKIDMNHIRESVSVIRDNVESRRLDEVAHCLQQLSRLSIEAMQFMPSEFSDETGQAIDISLGSSGVFGNLSGFGSFTEVHKARLNQLMARSDQSDFLWNLHSALVTMEKSIEDEVSPEDQTLEKELQSVRNARARVKDIIDGLQQYNWRLCRACLGDDLLYPSGPDGEVFAAVVHTADQEYRLRIAWWCFWAVLAIGLLTSLNHTSMHSYYAENLGQLWLVQHPEHGLQIPLRQLDNCQKGGPLHLINGTLNLHGRSHRLEKDRVGRFTFSKTHCGSRRTDYKRTSEYIQGSMDLASVVAVSGGAVSPYAIDNVLVRMLLTLANCRLGRWVHHPGRAPYDVSWPSPLYLVWQSLTAEPEDRRYLFVSDGGHNENTGISALLERRCRYIIALDASHDPDFKFEDLYRLLRESKDLFGIRIHERDRQPGDDDFKALRPTNRISNKHLAIFDIEYPAEGNQKPFLGTLIYVKSSITGDEGYEITSEMADSQQYPHDSTADLFFSPQRFNAYRALGEHLGDQIPPDFPREFANRTAANSPSAPPASAHSHDASILKAIEECQDGGQIVDLIVREYGADVEKILTAISRMTPSIGEFNILSGLDGERLSQHPQLAKVLDEFIKKKKRSRQRQKQASIPIADTTKEVGKTDRPS